MTSMVSYLDNEAIFVELQDGSKPEALVNRLPNEILGEIFAICVCISLRQLRHSRYLSEAPWLLTRICRLWTNIALSTSQLWSTFSVYLDPNDARPSTAWPVKMHLERSRSHPLNIHADFSPYPHTMTHPIFAQLLMHHERWESVRFDQACHWALLKLSDMQLVYPLLKELRIYSGHNQPAILEGFMYAPLLHSLSIDGFRLPHLPPTLHDTFPYHQLTKLAVSRMVERELVWVMSRVPALEECVIENSLQVNDLGDDTECIHLPHLASLTLRSSVVGRREGRSGVFNLIIAPQLTQLSVEVTETHSKECLQAFLSRSLPHLKRLALHSAFPHAAMDWTAVLRTLWQAPTLQQLQIENFIFDDESSCGIFSPMVAHSLLAPCPALESLDFRGWQGVGKALFPVMVSLSNLQHLPTRYSSFNDHERSDCTMAATDEAGLLLVKC